MSIVKFEGSTISFNVRNVSEAKLAVKEIKLKKREFASQKKLLVAQQKLLRADYTHATRTRMPAMRGGGFFGKMVRAGQSASRSADRANLAHKLQPLEAEKNAIDNRMANLDSVLIQLEAFILKHQRG